MKMRLIISFIMISIPFIASYCTKEKECSIPDIQFYFISVEKGEPIFNLKFESRNTVDLYAIVTFYAINEVGAYEKVREYTFSEVKQINTEKEAIKTSSLREVKGAIKVKVFATCSGVTRERFFFYDIK